MTPSTTTSRPWAVIGVVCYVAVLLVALLNPSPAFPTWGVSRMGDLTRTLGEPTELSIGGRLEFQANVLAFLPLSVLGSLAWPRLTWRDWTAYGFVASFGVETIQALLLAGRSATFVDVVANTLGSLVGAALVSVWRRLRSDV